jgi:Rieske Fe-S protein
LAIKKQRSASEGELSKMTGLVMKKEKLAIYKDGEGNMHFFSAVCTHLGCIVSWNELEKSFDCPCHGSRFSAQTGKVINGPANTPLELKNNE